MKLEMSRYHWQLWIDSLGIIGKSHDNPKAKELCDMLIAKIEKAMEEFDAANDA